MAKKMTTAQSIAKALKSGALTPEKYKKSYDQQVSKIRKHMDALRRSYLYEFGIENYEAKSKRPLQFRTSAEAMYSGDIREMAIELENVYALSYSPFLQVSVLKGSNFYHSLIRKINDFGSYFADTSPEFWNRIKYYEKRDYKAGVEKRLWQTAFIRARYMIDDQLRDGSFGYKFSDAAELLSEDEDNLEAAGVEDPADLKSKVSDQLERQTNELYKQMKERLQREKAAQKARKKK